MGRTMAFTKPKMIAIPANTVHAALDAYAGTSHAATTSATAVMNQWIRIRMSLESGSVITVARSHHQVLAALYGYRPCGKGRRS